MVNIRISVEKVRGCGYRKPGGLYLVSGALSRMCGKLPAPLHVCPVCNQGIKPVRGFSWINAKAIFSSIKCQERLADESCSSCVCGDLAAERGGLIWVGEAFYETSDAFVREAVAQGISRRIPAVPRGFKANETVVYLAHRKVLSLKSSPGIFSAFVPTAIEYVVKETETEEELNDLEKRGISLVKVIKDAPEQDLFPSAN